MKDVQQPRALETRGRILQAAARLFALKQWPKRIFSATVDQFLAFLQYGYGPMCQLPLLVDSVLVVDEVHTYRGIFGSHVANVLRRLQCICDQYGAHPRFVGCSVRGSPSLPILSTTSRPLVTLPRSA